MKAVILTENKKMNIIDIPIPKINDLEVLVKVFCVGICGTDVAVYQGHYPSKENVILGHEFCGKVVKVGSKVKDFREDDYVTSEASWGCGTCYWCKRTQPSYCISSNALGRSVDGALSEFIKVPCKLLHKISRKISNIGGQGVVSVATGLHAINRTGIKVGDSVLIVGPGYNGLIQAQLSKQAGAIIVGVVGANNDISRLQLAKKLGADFTVNIEDNPNWKSSLLNGHEKMGFDVLIEASGTVGGLLSCVDLVKKGGTIIEFGTSAKMINNLPQGLFYSKEITIKGSKGGYGFYPKAIELIELGKINVESLVTHKFTLKETPKAFKMIDGRMDDILRAVIFCNEETN